MPMLHGEFKTVVAERLSSAFALILVIGLFAVPVAYGQQIEKVFKIGYLSHSSGLGENEEALRDGLREIGYGEGRNLVIEWRFAKGDLGKHRRLAASLANLKVDCIVTVGVSPTRAAMQATRTIPILMANASDDPVESGLVASLARPGGNVTGFTDAGTELAAKRLELLVETLPAAKRVGVLWHMASPVGVAQFRATRAAAGRLGVDVRSLAVRGPEDLEPAFLSANNAGAQALIVVSYGFVVNQKARVAELAIRHRLPTISTVSEMADAGALMSYAPDLRDHFRRRVPRYIHRILLGAQPADLPVERPEKVDLIVNLKTAKAIGVTVPQSVLLRAERMIE